MTRSIRALVVLTLFAVGVHSAYAQPFACIATAGVPARVRAEGRTELVGDLVLNCAGTVPAGPIPANIQIFLNTNITSRITDPGTNTTDALLSLGEPAPAAQVLGVNVFQGVKVPGYENSLIWLGIPIIPGGTPPGSFSQIVRITNVRGNAPGVPFTPPLIYMFVTIMSPIAIPINNPEQVVAAGLPGLAVHLRNCQDDGGMGEGIKPPLPKDYSPAGLFKFLEGYDGAFKTQIAAGQDGAPLGVAFPGSESGYVNTAKLGPTIGKANTGARLIARFANIPDDVSVFVTTTQLGTGTTPGTQATLVSVTDPTGASGSLQSPVPPSWPPGVDACTGGNGGIIAQVSITAGSGAATWEIAAQSPSMVETVAVGVEFSSRLKGKPARVAFSFAPLSNDDKASATSPIPRFAQPLDAYVILPRR